MRLDTNSDNYDRGKGEQFALNTDGCNAASSSDRYFKSNIMDKQTLMGSSVVSEGGGGRYAVGRLQGKELHLTEVQGVLQLRPSLGYMDKSDKTARAEGRVKDDPDDPDAEDEKQPQAVTVKFSRVRVKEFQLMPSYGTQIPAHYQLKFRKIVYSPLNFGKI